MPTWWQTPSSISSRPRTLSVISTQTKIWIIFSSFCWKKFPKFMNSLMAQWLSRNWQIFLCNFWQKCQRKEGSAAWKDEPIGKWKNSRQFWFRFWRKAYCRREEIAMDAAAIVARCRHRGCMLSTECAVPLIFPAYETLRWLALRCCWPSLSDRRSLHDDFTQEV